MDLYFVFCRETMKSGRYKGICCASVLTSFPIHPRWEASPDSGTVGKDANLEGCKSPCVTSAIIHAQNIEDSIRILMKCIPTWDVKMTMDLLELLPTPFIEIIEYGKSPKLPKTQTNRLFAKLLETHNIISSATEKEGSIKINTFKSFN